MHADEVAAMVHVRIYSLLTVPPGQSESRRLVQAIKKCSFNMCGVSPSRRELDLDNSECVMRAKCS